MERPPRIEPPSFTKCFLKVEPNTSIQRPPRTRNPGPFQQPLICETLVPMQSAPMSLSGSTVDGGAKHLLVASVPWPPRSEPPGPVQRPPRSEPPGPVQRPPRSGPPGPSQRLPRSEPPGPSQRPPRSEPPGPSQRPPRSEPPGPPQRPPRSEPPGPTQRPPTSESTWAVQRPPRSEPPGPVQRPPRSEPSAHMNKYSKRTISTMERPPRTDAPVPVDRPPQTDSLVRVERPSRADPPVSMERPPRTNPPAPVQRPHTMAVQGGLKDLPVSMQRPPRTDNPAPVNLPPRYESSVPVHRTPISDPPRPPRSDPPGPIQRHLTSEPPGHVRRHLASECSEKVQSSDKASFSDLLQKPTRAEHLCLQQSFPGILDPASVCSLYSTESLPAVQRPSTTADLSQKRHNTIPPRNADEIDHVDLCDIGNGKSSEFAREGSNTGLLSNEHSHKDSHEGAIMESELEPDKTDEKNSDDPQHSWDNPDADARGGDEEDQKGKRRKRKILGKRKRENKQEEDADPLTCDLDLDRALDDRAKHHNLTVVNVRNILHEVITNEHVVAMMKAAITDTEGLPMFEPKMTRSKLKEVVEKGVVIPTWNMSPIKKGSKPQVPQFVDIPLEEEDSSDEEYQPEEEEEDETAEESLLESDVESTAYSPRGHKRPRIQHASESQEESMDCQQQLPPGGVRHISAETVPMGPPPPPKVKPIQDSSFMETLHAVDEELDSNPVIINSFQTLGDSLIACRTRSKRPLKDVPIEQLEAKLQAPDITPDMYDPNTADDDNWKMWLRSLMQVDVGNEDEADDDDDPEYNILEDWDEPDTEDLRNDRAVRITKKEVNELMEELFETFQDEMGISHLEDEGPDEEDSNTDPLPDFNTPHAIRFEEPLANLLTEQHRTVRAQLEYLRMKKNITRTEDDRSPVREPEMAKLPPTPKVPPVMCLDVAQRKRLQQQMQQHVQLLTQIHLLTFQNPRPNQEANTAQMYLVELSHFAESSALSHQPLTSDFRSMFEACNLKDALQLIPLVHSQVLEDTDPKPPQINVQKMTNLPTHIAWIMATRPLFMYPELLPICAMKARGPRDRVFFTKAEDNLLALGLKHFEGTDFSKQLISKYLLTAKTSQQLTVRIKNLTMKKAPENIFKFYRRTEALPSLSKCCEDVQPQDAKPPVEREKHRLPFWVKASLSSIEAETKKLVGIKTSGESKYPLLLPPGVTLTLKPLPRSFFRRAWRQKKSTLKPLLIRPSAPKPPAKSPSPQTLPIRIFGQVPPVIQSAVTTQGIGGLPMGPKVPEVCFPIPSPKQPSQVPTATVTCVPPTHEKMVMSAVPTQAARKPLICGVLKRKTVSRTSGVKAAPHVHSGPLLFALPSGALKLVSLGTPCSVLQPVNTGTGVHVATVLLNSPQIPLNQTFSQSLVSMPCEVSDNSSSPTMEVDVANMVKKEEDEWDCVSITIKVEAEESHASAPGGGADAKEDSKSHSGNTPPGEGIGEPGSPNEDKAELKIESGDVGGMPELLDEPVGMVTENESAEPGDMQEPENVPEDDHTEVMEHQNQETGAVGDSPKNTSSSTDGDVEVSSPAGVPIDSSSPLDGQEMDNEKDVPEEEEEEFDLTQDEDEMSSASEESVLSVPELQETMEKLTWLASERRLSQEGDSEDNSQEENTEPEEEEEEEAEIIEGSLQKAEGMTDEASKESEKLVTSHLSVPSPAPVETSVAPAGERRRGGSKAQGSHRARSRKGRVRASKDASKLLLLYDEKILMKDPLRDQKDMAFAQSYLSRVRDALQSVPGTYEEFLNLIYEFETRRDKRTAVDLYESLRQLLQDWPQLLKDFAAFLLPEQALECGLFEEQQAFDKSRRFLRQLEICFLENPTQHQKIIKLLQSCAECPLQEIGKLKTQMWQLLRGHIHLQEEFSLFFDQLRPPVSRMEDFEVMNWTEDKEYTFDGFEEVTLPDVEEEEEQNKRHKRRKEAGPGQDNKEVDWPDGGKDCPCSCHEVGPEQRLKRCKRRMCGHCGSSKKATDGAGPQATCRQGATIKETGSKSAFSEERPASGARGPAGSRGLPIPESNVSVQRPRSVPHTRGVTGTDRLVPWSAATKDNSRAASRGSRRHHTTKGPHPAVLAEEERRESTQPQPSPCTEASTEDPPTCPTPTTAPPAPLCSDVPVLPLSDATETLTMCAKNITVSSSGEKVILWTREADRVILTTCQERGAHDETFHAISVQLGNKSASEVSQRFRELINLFQTGCVSSSEDEEEEECSAGNGEDEE